MVDPTETSNGLTETIVDPTETTIGPRETSDDLAEKWDRMTSSFSRAENEEDDIAIIIVSAHTNQHRSLEHTSSKTTDLTEMPTIQQNSKPASISQMKIDWLQV